MKSFEKTINIIESNRHIVDFREFGDGISEEWIRKAETALKIKLPPSYIWWLKNYGGGEILGEEIFSIYEMDFDEVVGGDVVRMSKIYREKGFDQNCIIISVTDRGEVFYLDGNKIDVDMEYPVYLNVTNSLYAENFILFLERRINEVIT